MGVSKRKEAIKAKLKSGGGRKTKVGDAGKGISKSSEATNGLPKRQKLKGENFYVDKHKLARRKLLKSGRATRNAAGEIIKEAELAKRKPDAPVVRIEPNRKWFGNTRALSHEHLERFRNELQSVQSNPYQVLLKQSKLPMSLLRDDTSASASTGTSQGEAMRGVQLLTVEPFDATFGRQARRTRPKLAVDSLQALCDNAQRLQASYDVAQATMRDDPNATSSSSHLTTTSSNGSSIDSNDNTSTGLLPSEMIFKKGQSKRIWNELYKVIDSSDVLIHVLDARNPEGTLCRRVETFLAKEAPHKHVIYVLNKADLVPASVAEAWVRRLAQRRPTLAFHASLQHPWGKAALLGLLRQFANLHPERKQIAVGMVGYPNIGKSSIINALRRKKVCSVAPVPGETKVWQYVTLMKRIYLIDCPGIVPVDHEDCQTELVLKGAIRIENIASPEDHVSAILERVKPLHLCKAYGLPFTDLFIDSQTAEPLPFAQDQDDALPSAEHHPSTPAVPDATHFLTLLAKKSGKLLKGGEPDTQTVAKMVLNDWLRGELPYYTPVPSEDSI